MAVTLYRQGTTHAIRGTLCEIGTFEADEVHSQLQNGWFKTPEGAYETEAETETQEQPETEEAEAAPEAESVLNLDEMTNKEIREAAQKAGIESWDTTRIKTLKAELS